MTDCNAKMTTVTTTDDVVGEQERGRFGFDYWPEMDIPDGVAVVRDGDRLLRLDVVTLTCVRDGPPHTEAHIVDEPFLEWDDDTPGATPHKEADR